MYKYSGNTTVTTALPPFNETLNNFPNRHNNFLPLYTSVNEDVVFKQLLMDTRDTVLAMIDHQHYPLSKIFNTRDNRLHEFDAVIGCHGIQTTENIETIPATLVLIPEMQ